VDTRLSIRPPMIGSPPSGRWAKTRTSRSVGTPMLSMAVP